MWNEKDDSSGSSSDPSFEVSLTSSQGFSSELVEDGWRTFQHIITTEAWTL